MKNRKYRILLLMVIMVQICIVSNVVFAEASAPSSNLNYVDLNNWYNHGDGDWSVADGGRKVIQNINGWSTFYLSPDEYINKVITGTIKVDTTSDDDMVGFVLGYQDPVGDYYDFVLFDWKQGPGSYNVDMSIGKTGAGPILSKTSYEGYTLGYLKGNFDYTYYYGGFGEYAKYIWFHEEEPGKYELFNTVYGSDKGWSDQIEYQFKILYTDTQIKVLIDDELFFHVTGTFKSGKIGFYNLSQADVVYGDVQTAMGTTTPAAPIALNDKYGVSSGDSIIVDRFDGVLFNDYDPNLDRYEIVLDSDVSNGTLNCDLTDGSFDYTPTSGFTGMDSFTYHLVETDGGAKISETITVELNVISGVNTAPTDISLSNNFLDIDGSNGDIVGDLSTIDSNEGDFHDYMLVDSDGGVFGISGNQILLNDSSGVTSSSSYVIKVRATDFQGLYTEKTFTIEVVSNNVPTADDATLEVIEDLDKTGTLIASDLDGDNLTYSIVSVAGKGTATITDENTGAYRYIPNADETGSDSFTFKVNDGESDSNTATITVNITATVVPNNVPTADDATLEVIENLDKTGTLIASDLDGDNLTYSILSVAGKGIATITDENTGAYRYTPNADETGSDSFTFKVNDGKIDSSIATITVNVIDVNDKPTARNDLFTTNADAIGRGTLIGHDIESANLEFSIESQGSKGNVIITNSNLGTFEYTPVTGATGSDSFTFKVNDGELDSGIATINVELIPSGVADMSTLRISEGVLSPEFTTGTMSYFIDLSNDISQVDLECGLSNASSTLRINGDEVVDYSEGLYNKTVQLDVGSNEIDIQVIAQDKVTSKTYKLTATRGLSTNVELGGVNLGGVGFTPGFTSVNTVYNATVSYGESSIIVTPFKSDENAVVKVNGNNLLNGVYVVPLITGENTITIGVTAQDGTSNKNYTFIVNRANKKKADSSGSTQTPEPELTSDIKSEPVNISAEVIINDVTIQAGNLSNTMLGDKSLTTVVLDGEKLEEKLEVEAEKVVITIPVSSEADIVVGVLNGQMVKNMENHEAIVELETDILKYTLPAKQINIEQVSEQLGSNVELKDIIVEIQISKASENIVKLVEDLSNDENFTIMTPAVEFNVKCTYDNKTVEVTDFNAYVERSIRIPNNIEHKKITTAVVVDPSGVLRHVPTKVVLVDGAYYAQINSLSNSAYSVIWNPIEFEDVANHWAGKDINDMASRMVNIDLSTNVFEPNLEITRAEFAAIIVRGLGLKTSTNNNPFNDVNVTESYYNEIETAYEYGLMVGVEKNRFGGNLKITREQAMVVVAKAMKITGLELKSNDDEMEKIRSSFSDSTQFSIWANESIAACVKAKIIWGKSNGILAPKDEITRAEVMAIVRRLLKNSSLM